MAIYLTPQGEHPVLVSQGRHAQSNAASEVKLSVTSTDKWHRLPVSNENSVSRMRHLDCAAEHLWVLMTSFINSTRTQSSVKYPI